MQAHNIQLTHYSEEITNEAQKEQMIREADASYKQNPAQSTHRRRFTVAVENKNSPEKEHTTRQRAETTQMKIQTQKRKNKRTCK
jgi:hypothetical protein